MPFLVMKRSKQRSKQYPQLLPPFKKCIILRYIPEDYDIKIIERFGSGEYLITKFGEGCNGYTKFFHGMLNYKMRV